MFYEPDNMLIRTTSIRFKQVNVFYCNLVVGSPSWCLCMGSMAPSTSFCKVFLQLGGPMVPRVQKYTTNTPVRVGSAACRQAADIHYSKPISEC